MGKASTTQSSVIVRDLLHLYTELLIPFMKVRRDIPFPTESERGETDGEHAFTLSMFALTLAERMKFPLDRGLIAQYALVHDLVEAHAGDVSARSSDEALVVKVNKEREALLVIKEQFVDKAAWIPELIAKYEARADEEAKFVYATDKLMGAFAWLAGNGEQWHLNYPEVDGAQFHFVYARLRKKASLYPPLLDVFDKLHEQLDQAWPAYLKRVSKANGS